MITNYLKLSLFALGFSFLNQNANAQLNEGFEGTTFPPTGWTSFIGTNGEGTVENWYRNTTTPHTGTGYAYVRYEVVTSSAQDWLVTPQTMITSTNFKLSFWEREGYSLDYLTNYAIKISTSSQTDHASFTNIITYPEDVVTYNVYKNRIVDLSSYIGQNVYIAFVMTQNDGDNWYIDDVKLVGNCVSAPDSLSVLNVNSNSALINWTNGNTGNNYQWTVDGVNFNLVSDTVVNVTGLSPVTDYTMQVRQICGAGDTSDWTSINFTTTCAPMTLPWSEGFEGVNVTTTSGPLPNCWSETGNFFTANGIQSYYREPNSGDKYMYARYGISDIASTPMFNLTSGTEYKFDFYYAADNYAWDSVWVELVSASGARTMLGNKIYSFSDTLYNLFSETFTPSTTEIYHFDINVYTGFTPWYFRFDDFSLSQSVGLNEKNFITNIIDIYPNPTQKTLNLKTNANLKKSVIYDQLGREVITTQTQRSIDVSGIPTGYYFIKSIDVNGKTYISKFIKE